MSIEICYIYGGYQITDAGIKRPVRNVREIDQVTNGLYSHDTEQDLYLILDNRHFIGYTKKQLLALEQSIINCLTVAKTLGIDLTVTMRRELRNEIRPTAGLVSKVVPMDDLTVSMAYPHVELGKKIIPPMTDRVLRLADTLAVGIGQHWMEIKRYRTNAAEFIPYLYTNNIAQLGDLHPMVSTRVEITEPMVNYYFIDDAQRQWMLTVPVFYVDYEQAMTLIRNDTASKRYLDMFYNSTPDPVKRLADEVVNMLLPWSYRIYEAPAELPMAGINAEQAAGLATAL